jgi:isoleucyl-tRNA synthetase
MLPPLPPDVSFPDEERKTLEFWREQRIFEGSVEAARGKPRYVFYEGPPTANGMPHPGHVLTRVIKDVFLRYRTMCGHNVPRRAGWDTHGLPVEVEVEKSLGIHGKAEIEKYGVEAFTRRCLESVFKYIGEWRRMTERIAFWVSLDDAYATFHQSYVESVWWALKTLFSRDLLYQDYKVVWWWPQGGTALSAGEVGLGYKTVDDPSVVVRFPVLGRPKTSLLAWTTTPWTLPSNVGLAVAAKESYVEAEVDGETVILAERRLSEILGKREAKVRRTFPGAELEGVGYEPPFRYKEPERGASFRVVAGDFVTLDTGTGVVHTAPAFGEDDFRLMKEKGLGFLQLVLPDGTFAPEAADFAGRFCKEADRDIVRNLRQRGFLFSEGTTRHEYPFCWRADKDPLIQYARRSWFIRTTREIGRAIENNRKIVWQPEHIGEGRFGDFLRNNVDWALSRERWWGTPLPIWVNDHSGKMEAVGSVAEILERNPKAFDAFDAARKRDPSLSEHLRVHKPWIDEVTWTKAGEPGVYRRVPDVIDCWFDSGAMPFAQWGYPWRNRESFTANFPADFISEAVDQTRGWFYSLLAISTMLFPEEPAPHPFRSCVVLGHVTDKDGYKLSKSRKNYEDPMEMIESQGADAVRWSLFMGNVPGQNTRFFAGAAKEATRDFLLKIWNVLSFLVTYARIDGWKPGNGGRPAPLDRWLLAELDETIRSVRGSLDALQSNAAARRLDAFVDALSNWYVRRNRDRFWAEGSSPDKSAAYATLYEALATLSRLLAPFTPFLAEALHQRLVRALDPGSPLSVHLAPFPEPRPDRADEPLRAEVQRVRDLVALGLRVRSENNLKVRQPLSEAVVILAGGEKVGDFEATVADELNVHRVTLSAEPAKYVQFTVLPNFKALGPKLGKRLPDVKQALAKSDGCALHAELERTGAIRLGDLALGRDEVEIRLQAREGFAAASAGGRVVVLDTRVTPELRREGLAREAISRIQKARKEMDLPYEARIEVLWRAEGEVAEAIREHRERIAGETLAVRLEEGSPAAGAVETEVEGTPLAFSVARR